MTKIDLDSVSIVQIGERYSRQARSLLYLSYKDEPTFKYLLDAHRPGYAQRIRATIRELIRLNTDRGQSIFGVLSEQGKLLGVAFVSPPELKNQIAKHWLWRLKMTLTAGFEGTRRFVQYFTEVQESLPLQGHRMVSLIGIHPEYQKQGLGKMLLEHIHQLTEEDSESVGLFLDTGNNRYLEFYKKLGYQVYAELPLGSSKEFVLFRANPAFTQNAS